MSYKRDYGPRSAYFTEYEDAEGNRHITATMIDNRTGEKSMHWYGGVGVEGVEKINEIALMSDEEFKRAEENPIYSFEPHSDDIDAVMKRRWQLFDMLLDAYEPFTERGWTPSPYDERRAGILAGELVDELRRCPIRLGGDADRWIKLAQPYLDDCELGTNKTGSQMPCYIALDFIRSGLHMDRDARECFAPGKGYALWSVMGKMKVKETYGEARRFWKDIKEEIVGPKTTIQVSEETRFAWRGTNPKMTVELFDKRTGEVVIRKYLSQREFEKFIDDFKAGRWSPDIDWRIA